MNYNIIHLKCVDSTNTYLKELCKSEKPADGTVILADFQNKGKGQGTNSWYSSDKQNITLSMLFRPMINVSEHFSISEFISLALVDLLLEYGVRATIKWPNDIYLNDLKIAGILVENSIQGDKISQTIAGIGLNINEIFFPNTIPNPTSMKLILGKTFDISEVTEKLVEKLLIRYESLLKINTGLLHNEYINLLFRKDINSGFKTGNTVFQGVITGTDKSGELIIKKADGQEQRFLHGEISYII